MSAFFNITSLALGLVAWSVPLAFLLRGLLAHAGGVLGSVGACAASLLLQLGEIAHRVSINDYSAISDTIGAILLAGTVLVVVTFALNLVVCRKTRKKWRELDE